jgi:succinate-acetate transporter protein
MKKFFQSGVAFMVVALLCFAAGVLCFAAGVLSEKGAGFTSVGAVFTSVGALWLVMAIVVRAKNTKRQPPPEQS